MSPSDAQGPLAVVVGGSIAGLLNAAALTRSGAYHQAIVLDQDPDENHRTSVTQGDFIHALMAGGIDALEEVLPGLQEECVGRGCRITCTTQDAQLRMQGHCFKRSQSDVNIISLERPLFELCVRARVRELCSNVQVRFGHKVTNVDYDARRVEFQTANGQHGEITGDLLVMATGRIYLKLVQPLVTKTLESQINLGYACLKFELTKGLDLKPYDWIEPPWAGQPLGVLAQRLGGNKMLVVLVGYHDTAPKHVDSIDKWYKELPPHILSFLEDRGAHTVWERPRVHVFPTIVRRFFADKPGVLVVGDAVCSVDPAFGQGMSKAALEAREVLRRLSARKEVRQSHLSFASDTPHALTTSEASGHALFKGYAPPGSAIMRVVTSAVFQVCEFDAKVALAFNKVFQLRATPAHLVSYFPRIFIQWLMIKLGLLAV